VFTGWSWDCPDGTDNNCFFSGSVGGVSDPDRSFKNMVGYPQYHAKEEKSFLGTTIAAQATADPQASLNTALATLTVTAADADGGSGGDGGCGCTMTTGHAPFDPMLLQAMRSAEGTAALLL